MLKIEQKKFYIVKYFNVIDGDRIWSIENSVEDAEEQMELLHTANKNIATKIWIEAVKETITKEIEIYKKIQIC